MVIRAFILLLSEYIGRKKILHLVGNTGFQNNCFYFFLVIPSDLEYKGSLGRSERERQFDRSLYVKKCMYVNLNIHSTAVALSSLIHK